MRRPCKCVLNRPLARPNTSFAHSPAAMIGGETAAFLSSSALFVFFALMGAVLLQVQCKQSKRSSKQSLLFAHPSVAGTRLPQKGHPAASLPSARSLKTVAANPKKAAEPADQKPSARRPKVQQKVVASKKELSLEKTAFSSASDKSKKESSSALQSKEKSDRTEKTAQEDEEGRFLSALPLTSFVSEVTDLRTPSWMTSAPMPVFLNNIPVTPGPLTQKKGALKKK